MGTNGLYVFKYNNVCYVYFKGNDCSPHGLGKRIVHEINQMSAEEFIELKNMLRAINVHKDYNSSYCGYTSLKTSACAPENYVFYTSTSEPDLYIGIEYIYILDLDSNTFAVKYYSEVDTQRICFDMHNIPCDWEKICL